MSGDKQIDVEFSDPIIINGQAVKDFVLTREPTGRDFGRHSVTALLEGEIRALAEVTPKLIQPHISKSVVLNMSQANLLALTSGYAAFSEDVDFDRMARVRETVPTTTTTPSTPNTSSVPKAD